MSSKVIVLFTLGFPYGKGEAYLESEIKYLSKSFTSIYILPSNPEDGINRISGKYSNVYIDDSLVKINLQNKKVLFKEFFTFLRVFSFQLFHGETLKYLKYYKSFIGYFIKDINKKQSIVNFINSNNLSDAIFYDYWFVNSTISLAEIKRKRIISKFICRAHRFDLYDDIQFEKTVSFREFKLSYVNKLFTISKHGENYIKRKVEIHFNNKIHNSYLGTEDFYTKPKNENIKKDSILIVSCSNVIAIKRVELIAKILSQISSYKLHWVHFGDGPNLFKVKSIVENVTNKSFTFELKGSKPNSIIHSYYNSIHVDFFISLSISEGLPVSMMEAQSYGIPIIATNVNGVSEIVNETTGILLDLTLDEKSILNRIDEGIKSAFNREEIRQHFLENFYAPRNYLSFIKELQTL